jgi:hypothetical protein
MHGPHYVTADRVYYMALKNMDDHQNEDEGEKQRYEDEKKNR